MRTQLLLLALSGIGAAVLLGSAHDTPAPRTVTAFGPLEAPGPTPRVRATNARWGTIELWYVITGSDQIRHLGRVRGNATRTFVLGETADHVRIIVQPLATRDRFVTDRIPLDGETDIGIEVGNPIEETKVEVSMVEVVR